MCPHLELPDTASEVTGLSQNAPYDLQASRVALTAFEGFVEGEGASGGCSVSFTTVCKFSDGCTGVVISRYKTCPTTPDTARATTTLAADSSEPFAPAASFHPQHDLVCPPVQVPKAPNSAFWAWGFFCGTLKPKAPFKP